MLLSGKRVLYMGKYNADDCPNIQCKDCMFFKNNCKRCDGVKVQFAFPCFSSGFHGHHFIFKDFEPMHPEYADFQKWTCFEDFWEVYQDVWFTNPQYVSFTLNGDLSVRYCVKVDDFINGTMYNANGSLKAFQKMYYKQTRSGFGYKLVREPLP